MAQLRGRPALGTCKVPTDWWRWETSQRYKWLAGWRASEGFQNLSTSFELQEIIDLFYRFHRALEALMVL
jgi:hypothetical protein